MKHVIFGVVTIVALAGTALGARIDGTIRPVGDAGFSDLSNGVRAQVIPVNVTGVPSFTTPGVGNTEIPVFIGAGNSINGFGWSVFLTAFTPSWISHMGVRVSDSSGGVAPGGFDVHPGGGANASGGPNLYDSAGILILANYSIPDVVAGASGLVYLHFFEDFDDISVLADGVWGGTLFPRFPHDAPDGETSSLLDSTLFLQVVPSPSSGSLLTLAGVSVLGRKRRKARSFLATLDIG